MEPRATDSRAPHRSTLHGAAQLGKTVWDRMQRSRTLGLAAEMSFWVFLSLLPLAAVGGLVAARLAVGQPELARPIFDALPPAAVGAVHEQLVKVAAWNGGAVGPIATIVFVWLASSGVHSIFDAFEAEAGVERPWWKKRALAVVCCVALSLGFALVGLLGAGFGWIERASPWHPPQFLVSTVGRAVQLGMAAALLFALVLALFRVGVPPRARCQVPLVPGTLLVVALQVALGWGYRLYIATVGSGGAYQGGLAIVGVTMTTVYLFAVSILVGLEVNLALAKRENEVATTSEAPQRVSHVHAHT